MDDGQPRRDGRLACHLDRTVGRVHSHATRHPLAVGVPRCERTGRPPAETS